MIHLEQRFENMEEIENELPWVAYKGSLWLKLDMNELIELHKSKTTPGYILELPVIDQRKRLKAKLSRNVYRDDKIKILVEKKFPTNPPAQSIKLKATNEEEALIEANAIVDKTLGYNEARLLRLQPRQQDKNSPATPNQKAYLRYIGCTKKEENVSRWEAKRLLKLGMILETIENKAKNVGPKPKMDKWDDYTELELPFRAKDEVKARFPGKLSFRRETKTWYYTSKDLPPSLKVYSKPTEPESRSGKREGKPRIEFQEHKPMSANPWRTRQTPQVREEAQSTPVVQFPGIGALPTYNEKTVPGPGWYWHTPSGTGHGRFVELFEILLQGALHNKEHQGSYTGPIPVPAPAEKQISEKAQQHEIEVLCSFINREMQMTAGDPRIQKLIAEIAAGPKAA